jgi:serine/threonine/tyrosine-interacting protein
MLPKPREPALSDNSSHHQRQEEYSTNIPSAPRISIPPPAGNNLPDSENLGVILGQLRHNEDPRYNIDFVAEALPATIVKTYAEWDWDLRRRIQAILPFLCIGPVSAVTKEELSKNNVTLLIGLCTQTQIFISKAIQAAKEADIATSVVVVSSDAEMIKEFHKITEIINEHLARVYKESLAASGNGELGMVVITCETGSDKSAAAAAAYLMDAFEDMDVTKAMQICISCRFSCNFNPWANTLKTYEGVVMARSLVLPLQDEQLHLGRSIRRVRTPEINANFRRHRDRFLHNIDDEVFADEERFAGRQGPQPFVSQE